MDVHFGASGFNGRVFLGYRPDGGKGVYTLSCLPIDDAREFIGGMHISRRCDYYITANTFSGVERKAEGLFSLNNIVIDVDCHGDHFDPSPFIESFLELMRRNLTEEGVIPPPNSVVYTGRGVQLWWAIEPVSVKCAWYYERIRHFFISEISGLIERENEALFPLSADAGASGNSAGYFRLPGTCNTHTGGRVTFMTGVSRRYSTHDLIKYVKDTPPPLSDVKREKTRDFAGYFSKEEIYIFKTPGILGYQRVRQLVELRLLRNRDVGEETRNNLCFLVYNALLPMGEETAWDRLLKFNEGFKQPLTERELESCIVTARRKGGYKYSNAAVISMLEVTPEEQMAIGLFIPEKEYDPMTRVSPSASRNAARKLIKADRNAKIAKMVAEGMSDSAIAKELGINRNTVASVRQSSGAKPTETARELILSGLSNAEIARRLNISIRTVQRARTSLKSWGDKLLKNGSIYD